MECSRQRDRQPAGAMGRGLVSRHRRRRVSLRAGPARPISRTSCSSRRIPLMTRVVGRLFGRRVHGVRSRRHARLCSARSSGRSSICSGSRAILGDDEDAARYAVWLLAAYPFALFYGAIYTESLFLLGAVGAFYHLRRREWTRRAHGGCWSGSRVRTAVFCRSRSPSWRSSPSLPRWLAGGRAGATAVSSRRASRGRALARPCRGDARRRRAALFRVHLAADRQSVRVGGGTRRLGPTVRGRRRAVHASATTTWRRSGSTRTRRSCRTTC